MNASRNRTWLMALMALASAAIVGCGGDDGPEGEDVVDDAAVEAPRMDRALLSKDRRVKVGIVTRYWKTAYSRGLYIGALKTSREMADVFLYRSGIPKETDTVSSAQRIRDFRHQGVDTFIWAPIDSKSPVGEAKSVISLGQALVVIDTKIDCDGMVGTIVIDHRGAGTQAAEQLTGKLGGKGDVLLMRYVKSLTYAQEREAGFLESAKAANLKVVSSDQYAGETAESAHKKAAELLKKFPKVAGVFTTGEMPSLGMLKALREAKLAGKVKFIACDPNPELVKALAAGHVTALLVPDTIALGAKAIKAVVGHVRQTAAETSGTVRTILVTKENVGQASVKEILEADLKPYMDPPEE